MEDIRKYLKETVIGKHEGGYQNREDDTGNFIKGKNIGTKYGISAPALASYLKRTPTKEEMLNLSEETAVDILYKDYYVKNKIDKLPEHLQKNVLDMTINAGPRGGIGSLQKAVGAKPDGIIGPNTLKAIEESGITNNEYVEARLKYYKSLNKPETWQRIWEKRANSFLDKTEGTPSEYKKMMDAFANPELVPQVQEQVEETGGEVLETQEEPQTEPVRDLATLVLPESESLEGISRSVLNPVNTDKVQESDEEFYDLQAQEPSLSTPNKIENIEVAPSEMEDYQETPSDVAMETVGSTERPFQFDQELQGALEESQVEEDTTLKTDSTLDLGAREEEYSNVITNIQNLEFEGMGDDLVNKFIDQNALGFIAQGAVDLLTTSGDVDPNFNALEVEGYEDLVKDLDNSMIEEVLKSSNNYGDFMTNVSSMQAYLIRKNEMEDYARRHPVLSGTNSVANMLVEGAAFMPVAELIGGASMGTKIKSLRDLQKYRNVTKYAIGELGEQGIQEIIWANNDREYEFDPAIFALAIGAGVGLRTAYDSVEIQKTAKELLSNEGGFINLTSKQGKDLVAEVTKRTNDAQAVALAERVTKKKKNAAIMIRKNLEAERLSILRKIEKSDKILKQAKKGTDVFKKAKTSKQKAVRQLDKFDKKLPQEIITLADGTHPKLSAQVNPEFSVKTIAEELDIPKKYVKNNETLRKFLGLDTPDIAADFVIEGEKKYANVMMQQLSEMRENRRINLNETFKKLAGTDSVKKLDDVPVIGKLGLGDKLNQLASTDGPMSQFLFNKGNLVNSENPYVASFYNWMAPDGAGRMGTSRIRAIESQQKYAKIYGGELMNIFHTQGERLYNALEGGTSVRNKVKGVLSPDDYENKVIPMIRERLLDETGKQFRRKYGDNIADIADDFVNDFNSLNKRIVDEAKSAGVEGVSFDATEGWFHRSWDFNKARAVNKTELEETVAEAMMSHMRKMELEFDEADIRSQAKKFAYGLQNADLHRIEELQADWIKKLAKLADQTDGKEAKVLRTEVERLTYLKQKNDAGDLANRVQMDLTVTLPDGRQLSDILEDNLIHSQRRYTERMSARISAAEHGIKNLNDMDEWIKDAEKFEIDRFAKMGEKNPRQKAKFAVEAMRQDLTNFKFGGMSGLDDLHEDMANDFLRFVKKYNYARLMQYAGVSSIAEIGGTLVEAGVGSTLEAMRGLRQHIYDLYADRPSQFTNVLYDELRTITGVGLEGTSWNTKGMSRATRVFDQGLGSTVEKGIDSIGRLTHSTFGGIETVGRRMTANALAIKWANHFTDKEKGGLLSAFFGSNGVSNRVLENSNLGKFDEAGEFIFNDNYAKIKKNMIKNAKFDENGRLVQLNLKDWDSDAARAFGDVLEMQANHILVTPDGTTMALWQSTTVGQILNQFRTFTINATTKVAGQAVSNAAISSMRGDQAEMVKAAQKIFWGTALGMLSVTLRQGIQRAGGDREVDLYDEGLIKAAAIGFSRSSIAGNIPTISDTISGAFGIDPIFEKTSSVGRSKNFFNLATTPTGQAVGGIYKGTEKTLQGDLKGGGMQLLKTSPIYRQIGFQQLFNFVDKEK
ncbi:MAG: putative peptidoglycan hydrolase [Prokaryotic dsDNA virus sp.]|jgi:lysozyme family protein|nr:hypothetical protein [Flavobacteriaceae bacterium]QDP68314.1 MAG: putative peptidoglycan hydrolase [Prokaryotic dsDNA virus sp.]|tara:strand:- start:11637 stop:16376 length:4740 start_codon:yes stop_codon:yes gene_type:complete